MKSFSTFKLNGYSLDENIVQREIRSAYFVSDQNEDNFLELHFSDNDPKTIVALVYEQCELKEIYTFNENINIEKELNDIL